MKTTTTLQQAFIVAQESKCLSYKVGAMIEKDGRVISSGFNGTVTGRPNCDEVAHDMGWSKDVVENGRTVRRLMECHSDEYSKWADRHVIHAEMNAILFAARSGSSIQGATMYVTMSPCIQCAKTIAQSGIKTLVYCDDYAKSDGEWIDELKQVGIKVIKLDRKYLSMLDWNNIETKRKRV